MRNIGNIYNYKLIINIIIGPYNESNEELRSTKHNVAEGLATLGSKKKIIIIVNWTFNNL